MKNKKKRNQPKPKMNIYVWGQKNKKLFAGVICAIIVLGMLASLLQV